MEPEEMQTVAARDQLWASLRALRPEIERLATSGLGGPRDAEVVALLARIVVAELDFRAGEGA